METVTIRYEKLFSILLAHADFPALSIDDNRLSLLTNELKVEIDAPTSTLFEQHGIQYRFEYDSLSCFVRVATNSDVPFFPLPSDFSARFLFSATGTLITKMGLPPSFGGEYTYHLRVKLKTTASTSKLLDSPLTTVESAVPDLIFHAAHDDNPSYWEQYPTLITGYLAVVDIVTEGSKKNRLFKQESTQALYYSVSNGKSDQHLYQINLS